MRTKILLSFGMFFFSVCQLTAQFNTGRYLLGGGFSLYNAKSAQSPQSAKNTSATANIQFGKIVKENTVAGIILSFSSYKAFNVNSADTNKNQDYGVGIFYRKYTKLAKNLTFFGEVNARFSHREASAYYISQSSKTISNGVFVSFVPGISYTVYKALQVELLMPDIVSLGYSHASSNFNNAVPPGQVIQKTNTFSANTNLNANLLSSFGIGFKFLLGKNAG